MPDSQLCCLIRPTLAARYVLTRIGLVIIETASPNRFRRAQPALWRRKCDPDTGRAVRAGRFHHGNAWRFGIGTIGRGTIPAGTARPMETEES